MNIVVYHIVSGQAYFTGIVLLLIAAVVLNRPGAICRRIAVLSFLIGMIEIVASSTPIPYAYYAFAGVVTLTWIVSWFKTKWRRWTTPLFAAVCVVAALLELPFHLMPALKPLASRSIVIIGDSVTAGVGGDEKSETWPKILAREHGLQIQDISHMGDTAASALKRAQSHEIAAPLVIIEIGGNDVLGSTSSPQFEHDLDELLQLLAKPERQILMFELPLPPLYLEYGRIQRQLAFKYNVALIPKRVFLSVVAGTDATLDSIHLSQSGHQQMADTVCAIVKGSLQ